MRTTAKSVGPFSLQSLYLRHSKKFSFIFVMPLLSAKNTMLRTRQEGDLGFSIAFTPPGLPTSFKTTNRSRSLFFYYHRGMCVSQLLLLVNKAVLTAWVCLALRIGFIWQPHFFGHLKLDGSKATVVGNFDELYSAKEVLSPIKEGHFASEKIAHRPSHLSSREDGSGQILQIEDLTKE